MKPVLVLDVVGLTPRQIGARTPELAALARRGASAPMDAVLPAVTLTAQATFLTGLSPAQHGAVANGWYFRELGEALLWRQPNELVAGKKLYERARERDPAFTCAKLFWWWNLGAAVDWSLTPRPFYPADGRKIPAVYGTPRPSPPGRGTGGLGFEDELARALGPFPFFDFWGPKAGLASSRWLTDAALWTLANKRPTLTLVYLPHLDYDHQRFGPEHPRSLAALNEVDALVGELVHAADGLGAETVVVSEYGLESVERPVPINRILREAGLLAVRDTPAGEVLDPFASRAFAVSDHQVAHVYVQDERDLARTRMLLEGLAGVAQVLDEAGKRASGLDHPRSGELVCVAAKGAWFTYTYWLDDARAPDFARTVDIHRKPGYDPCELFLDPALRFPKLRVALRLAQKALGMRYLMDVIPLDATLVKGSHGRLPDDPRDGPVFLSSAPFERCGGAPGNGRVDPRSFVERALALLERA
ncbi:MAG: alkaline phosphatase family protein [Planctomycetes bacterium]|nr:alkaline phosphatase family protein [Planctomycetota bacterium]